jgi:hypothetical protein
MRIENAPFIADESSEVNDFPTKVLLNIINDRLLPHPVRMRANTIVAGRLKWPPAARAEMADPEMRERI